MLTEERYQRILQILSDRNAVTVSELSQQLNISESTIRRDLNALAEMGKLNKVFGGATAYAAGIIAEPSSHRVFVDGKEVLRDILRGIVNPQLIRLVLDLFLLILCRLFFRGEFFRGNLVRCEVR